MKILVCEKSDRLRRNLTGYLEKTGFDVCEAKTPEAAFGLLEAESPQLVIADVDLPHGEGLSFAEKIRACGASPCPFLLVLLSDVRSPLLPQIIESGADDYLAKPFSREELLHRITLAERMIRVQEKSFLLPALAALAETGDPGTGSTGERIAEFCRLLAVALRDLPEFRNILSREYLEDLVLCAPLHDIGKSGLDKSLLGNPHVFTPAQRKEMEKHTVLGQDIVFSVIRNHPRLKLLDMAADITRSHHERFDGSGYPDGLEGKAIPLAARILAVADVYDALVSERIHRPAHTHAEARELVLQGSGTLFDPIVVEAFRRCDSRFEALAAKSL